MWKGTKKLIEREGNGIQRCEERGESDSEGREGERRGEATGVGSGKDKEGREDTEETRERCEEGMERENERERRERKGEQVWKGSGSDRREKRRGTGSSATQAGVFGRAKNGRYGEMDVRERERMTGRTGEGRFQRWTVEEYQKA